MKKIVTPINNQWNKSEEQDIQNAITAIQNANSGLTRHKMPYDQITILKVVSKEIRKALKSTGN
tara:strand:- start:652 stop:843 length:192 start_codon:yes stop_codon:yes gene_type:complete